MENLGKSGYRRWPGRRRIGAVAGVEPGDKAREARVRPGRTRDRRDGCRRTGPSDRTGAVRARDRDRSHDLADLALAAEQVVPLGHPAADAGRIAVELERPGVDRRVDSVQPTGVSAATMSRRFTRHGVPSMTSRQPSHRVATLSLTIVRIWTPMISIGGDGSRGVGQAQGRTWRTAIAGRAPVAGSPPDTDAAARRERWRSVPRRTCRRRGQRNVPKVPVRRVNTLADVRSGLDRHGIHLGRRVARSLVDLAHGVGVRGL